jgi:hypothetical protein
VILERSQFGSPEMAWKDISNELGAQEKLLEHLRQLRSER